MSITREQLEDDDAVVSAWRCPSCGDVFPEDEELVPIYECCDVYTRDDSADGESNRCPSCNKFGAKTGEFAPPCGCGEPAESIEAVEDEDGELIEVSEFIESGGASREAIEDQRAEEREAADAEREHALRARCRVVPVTEVEVGMMLAGDAEGLKRWPLRVGAVETRGDGIVVLWHGGMGSGYPSDAAVLIDPEEETT